MSLLIIQLPARARLRTEAEQEAAEVSPAAAGPREFGYVLSNDGVSVVRHGHCTAPMLPRAETVVAVMPAQDLSWHRVTLPKAPAGRLRAALAGLLEEALLDDPDDLHLAVAPLAKAGQPTWVAACDHTWLTGLMMSLEKARCALTGSCRRCGQTSRPRATFRSVRPGWKAPRPPAKWP